MSRIRPFPSPRPLASALLCLLLASCAGKRSVVLWTDEPAMAQYAEAFNLSQDEWKVEAVWRANPAADLEAEGRPPALIAARWLGGSALKGRFRPLDRLFTDLKLSRSAFYPALLAMGKIEGRQVLLPVSFNLPAAVFPAEAEVPGAEAFSLGLEEMRESGRAFNLRSGEIFTRMGFSPRWDPDFLLLAARLGGAGFREGKPLSWSQDALAAVIISLRSWTASANSSPEAEDEFAFRYLFDPGYRSVAAGRILYAYMESDELFLLPQDKRAGLDFRWIASNGKVPVMEDAVFMAICEAGGGSRAAEAFLSWFFKPESQRGLLEGARAARTLEKGFGIASGFSGIKSVNERDLPSFYPALVGHLPQEGSLEAPAPMGPLWPAMSEKLIEPWLLEAVSAPSGGTLSGEAPSGSVPMRALADALQAWLKENPQ